MLGLSNNLASGGFVDTFANLKSLSFDGSNEYLEIADDSSLDIEGAITVSAWIKPTVTMSWKGIVSKSDLLMNADVWDMYITSSQKIKFQITSTDAVESTTVLTNGQWYFVTGTYDGANIKLYINGTLEDTEARTDDIVTNNEPLKIGAYYSTANYFTGYIDEVAIWDTNLSANAITVIYNNGKPTDLRSNSGDYTSASSLVGYWRCGDGKLGTDADGTDDVIFDMDNASLGSELITGFTDGSSYPFDEFTSSGQDISEAIEDTGNWGGCASNSFSITSGVMYKCTFNLTYTSGDDTLRVVLVDDAGGGSTQRSNIFYTDTNGENTVYFVATATDGDAHLQLGTWHESDKINFSATDISLKKVNGNPAVMVNAESEDIQTEVPKQVKGLPAVSNTYSLSLDGTDDHIVIADDSSLDQTTALTLSCWAKNDNAGLGSSEALFGKYVTTGNQRSYILEVNSSEKLIFTASGDGTSSTGTQTSDSALSTVDSWHHYAITFSSGTCIMYQDGVVVPSTASSVPSSIYSSSANLNLGSIKDGGDYNWEGNIDEVAIFNTALDGDSIRAIWNNGVPTNLKNNTGAYDEYTDNLVAYYRCGDGTLDEYPLIGDEVTPTLGDEMVSEGDFSGADDDDPWVTGTGWSIGSGVATASTVTDNLTQAVSPDLIAGRTYRLSIDVKTRTAGTLQFDLGGATYQSTVNTGVQPFYFVAVNTDDLRFYGGGFSGTIADVSVKVVNGNAGLMTNMASEDIVEDTP